MAKKLGVSQGYYSQIEKGKIIPSDRLKNRIAYVFGLEKQFYIQGEIKNMPDEIFQYVIRHDPHYFPYEAYPVNHSEPNQSMIII